MVSIDYKDIEGSTIIKAHKLKCFCVGEVWVFELDNGMVLHEQDGEYGGNNLIIYDSLSDCLNAQNLEEDRDVDL